MLKHLVQCHEGQDMSEMKFGMKILKCCKSSFERQLQESVVIQHEKKKHHLLNSRQEYNRCVLPRVSTQLGDKEFKEYEKDLIQEKDEDDRIDKKIRELRNQKKQSQVTPNKT